jgi:hypothetical protein
VRPAGLWHQVSGRCRRLTPGPQPWRDKNLDRGFNRHPAAQRVRSRQDVPQPPGFVVEESHRNGHATEGEVDFQEPGEPADYGMSEANSSAVIAHNPQAGRQFSQRAPPGQGLHRHRDNDETEHDADQRQGTCGGIIKIRAGGGNAYQDDYHHYDVDRDIQQQAQGPGRERRWSQFQDNGLASDY